MTTTSDSLDFDQQGLSSYISTQDLNEASVIGTSILHYEILSELGRGGMGVVYKARDTTLQRDVALKFLPQDQSHDARDRFLREARAASRLNHKNIVSIHAIEQAERDFIVMEYVNGSTLRDVIARRDLSVQDAIRITRDLADALAKAHEAGIVHRDIKPDNILFTQDGEAKILDFGIAKLEGSEQLTQTDATLGTVAYMSPEQSRGEAIDGRSDLFSLGVILYEMVAGVAPFKGEYPAATTFRILNEEPEPIANLNPGAPPHLQSVVSKLLAKDPAERYQTGHELVADLASSTGSMESSAQTVSSETPTKPRNAFRLRPMWAVPGLILVGLLVASVVMMTRPPGASSIAVLPFENASGDDDVAFLCDGIPESLINRLALIPNFKVISRRSSFNYRDRELDPTVIGADLGVQTILLGRLEKRGDQLSISAELVDTGDNSQIWGERFTRPISGVLEIEDEISTSIANKLRLELSPETVVKLKEANNVDPRAYELFLKARFKIVGSGEEMDRAIDEFREATQIDPGFAPAWAGIAEGLSLQAYLTTESREALKGEARAALETALNLDPNSSEALVAKGMLNFYLDWDWDGSVESFERAIEINPGNASAYIRYADVLMSFGRFEEALQLSLKAKELDPISVSPTHDLGFLYFLQGNYEQAAEQFAAAVALHPDWTWGYVKGGLANARLGNREKALEMIDIIQEKTDGWGSALIQSWVALSYAAIGDTASAQVVVDRMKERGLTEEIDGMAMAGAQVAVGNIEAVLSGLERSVEEHSPNAVFLGAGEVLFGPAARTERFKALVEQMAFPE